jgi:hypothetical protein
MKHLMFRTACATAISLFLFCANVAVAAETTLPATDKNGEAPEVVKKDTENLISFECYVDVYSAYVWRGLVRTENPVWQPNAILTFNLGDYGSVYAELFGNFNTSTRPGRNHCGGLDEIDYIIGYEVDVSFVTLGIAHTWWTFPSVTDSSYEPSTREINLNAEIDNDYVVPFVELDIDYAEAEGLYGLVGLRKEVQILDQLMMGAEITLGAGTNPYTDYYFGNNSKSGLVDGNIALYAQFDITDNIYLGAKIAYTAVLDSDIQGVYPVYDNYPKDNMIWGGFTFGVTF